MKPWTTLLAAAGCVAAGLWLPSLWLPPSPVPAKAAPPPAVLQKVVEEMESAPPDEPPDYFPLRPDRFPAADALRQMLAGDAAGRTREDPGAWLAGLKSQPGSFYITATVLAWAETSPRKALEWLVFQPVPRGFYETEFPFVSGHPAYIWNPLIMELAARHPADALTLLHARPVNRTSRVPKFRQSLLNGCVTGLDADQALAAIRNAPAAMRVSAIATLLQKKAGADPRAALAWCRTLPAELRSGAGEVVVYGAWAKADPASAVKAWEDAHGVKDPVPDEVTSVWADKDPEAAWQWGMARGREGERTAWRACLTTVHRNGARALEMYSGLSAGLISWEKSLFSSSLLLSQPKLAMEWFKTLAPGDRQIFLKSALFTMDNIPVDARQALAQAAGTETPEAFRVQYLVDAEAAEKVLDSLAPERILELSSELLNSKTCHNPASVERMLQRIIRTYPAAESSVEGSKDVRSERMEKARKAVAEHAAALAGSDPAAAMTWAAGLPPGRLHTVAVANAAYTMGRYDLPAARAWAEKLPDGDARAAAIEMVDHLTKLSEDAPKPPQQ